MNLMRSLVVCTLVAIVAADDDVDRTDFSDPAMNADLDKKMKPVEPHEDVTSSAMLVDAGESASSPCQPLASHRSPRTG